MEIKNVPTPIQCDCAVTTANLTLKFYSVTQLRLIHRPSSADFYCTDLPLLKMA